MKKVNYTLLLLAVCLLVYSCKKDVSNSQDKLSSNHSISPVVKKTSASPDGVLYFSSQHEFNTFMNRLKTLNEEEVNKLIPRDFKSLSNLFKNFKLSSKKFNAVNSTHSNSFDLEEGSLEDYYYSQYNNLVPDDLLPQVLNENLQIYIGEHFYQVTRAGVFDVNENYINNYSSWYNSNETNIWETSNYINSNETMIDVNTYFVQEGIYRNLLDVEDITELGSPSQPVVLQPPYTGLNPNAGPAIPMNLLTVGENFQQKGIINGLPNNRRFIFEAYNINYLFWRSVGIEAKLQRLRRVWFASYYGESFADELIAGVDNMDLETDYFFPTPQYMGFMSMAQPRFNGLIDFQLGNFAGKVLNFDFTVNSLFGSQRFTSADISRYANGQLNNIANQTVDDIMQRMSKGFIDLLDPSYKERVKNEALQLVNIKNQSKLRFTIVNGYKTQGYSNKNNWRFDWNIMLSTSGQQPYQYTMKSGNFFGKARLGSNWYGIRIIRN